MKPDIFYEEALLVSSIEEMVDVLQERIQPLKPNEVYFEQVSIEKFVMETLLKEIHENGDVLPTIVVARFVEKMYRAAWENPSSEMTDVFIVSGTAAQSMLDDLYFD